MKLKEFLGTKHISMEQFRQLDAWKQEEWRRQHQEANRIEQTQKNYQKKSKEEIEYEDMMELLYDCGVPFSPSGEPLGI